MDILGIETSCDETAASVITASRNTLSIRSHIISSQIPTHRQYGGVVPEVAARHHVMNMMPVIDAALHDAHITPQHLSAIAVTRGPGLVTSLRVGVQTAKTLGYLWRTPLIGVNHMEGHLYANWLGVQKVAFPVIALIVSGGHTEIIRMPQHGTYQLIGRTRDDAAGEAFDKVAKLMGVPYPGGPHIQKLAEQGDPTRFDFPRPMINRDNFDFSFSGLKTSVLYLIKKQFAGKTVPVADISASFQQAAIDVLVTKTVRAAQTYNAQTVMLAGGVAANTPLRTALQERVAATMPKTIYHVPALKLCTDNASMIAIAGYWHARAKDFDDWRTLEADPNWELV